MIARRVLLAGSVPALVAVRFARAQQAERIWRIGYLAGGPRPADGALPAPLRRALAERGYVAGKNASFFGRWAEGKQERLAALAAELAKLELDVVLAFGWPSADAAKNASATLPIVFWSAGDAVGTGLVTNLARPGANITGISDPAAALSAKRLELLKEVVSKARRIAVLWNSANRAMTLRYDEIARAARALEVEVEPLGVREPDDFEAAFSAMTHGRPDALFLITDALTNLNRKRVLEFAAANRMPAMYEFGNLVREGGLMSYGSSLDDTFARAAVYVDRILKGSKPGGLPVEQPDRFYLAVNLKTAKTLGVVVPLSLLERADEVIE